MRHQESDLQKRCVLTLQRRYSQFEGSWNHSPNEGKRTEFQGAILKAMGMRRGWPDLEIMVARQGYHGLFIEFKSLKGSASKDQKEVRKTLEEQGYRYELVKSHSQFLDIVHDYLGPETDPDIEVLKRILES